MTQSNGLSPRTPRHQRQQQSPSESSKGKSVTIDKKRFFQEPMAAVAAGMEGPRSAWKAHSRPRSPTLPLVSPRQQLPVYPRGSFSKLRAAAVHQKPMARSTMRLLATIAIVCSVVPWVCTRGLSGFGGSLAMEDPTVPVTARTSFRGLARAELGNSKRQHGSVPTEHRCQSKAWADSMTADRGMCASLLPLSVVEADGWLVAVHVDRHPSVAPAGVAGKTTLRGATKRSTHRYERSTLRYHSCMYCCMCDSFLPDTQVKADGRVRLLYCFVLSLCLLSPAWSIFRYSSTRMMVCFPRSMWLGCAPRKHFTL